MFFIQHKCSLLYLVEVAAAANQKPEELERLITTFKERSSKYEKPKPLLPDIEYPRYQHGGRYPVPFYKQVGILTHRAILTTARGSHSSFTFVQFFLSSLLPSINDLIT